MPRLALIQAEIREVTHRLSNNIIDGRESPSSWGDLQPAREVLRLRLAELRRQEVIILHGRSTAKTWKDQAPHRKNADVDEQDISTVVYLLLLVAIVGVSLAMLMHAAGVLTR